MNALQFNQFSIRKERTDYNIYLHVEPEEVVLETETQEKHIDELSKKSKWDIVFNDGKGEPLVQESQHHDWIYLKQSSSGDLKNNCTF